MPRKGIFPSDMHDLLWVQEKRDASGKCGKAHRGPGRKILRRNKSEPEEKLSRQQQLDSVHVVLSSQMSTSVQSLGVLIGMRMDAAHSETGVQIALL